MVFVFVAVCSATTIELQSTYLGDGWFKYRMKVPFDPFFKTMDVGDFGIMVFTNAVDYGPAPQDWTNSPATGNSAFWKYQPPIPSQVRPYEREFLVRSSERSYRVVTNAIFLFSLRQVSDWFDYWAGRGSFSANMFGYVYLPCLNPCSSSMADGSPPDLTSAISIIDHDMTLDNLIVTNGQVMGVVFSAGFKSTVLLEGSMDSVNWTNIAYLWGDAGRTTWSTNVPLNDFGNFFRVELVAMDEHITNLPPLSANSAIAVAGLKTSAVAQGSSSTIPSLTCRPQGNGVAVQFMSEAGRKYAVQALDVRSRVVVTRDVAGTGQMVEAHFEAAILPNPVFFSAKPLP